MARRIQKTVSRKALAKAASQSAAVSEPPRFTVRRVPLRRGVFLGSTALVAALALGLGVPHSSALALDLGPPTLNWVDPGSGGAWDAASNWHPATVPNDPAANAVVPVAADGPHGIDLGGDTFHLQSLTLNGGFDLENGALDISDFVTVGGVNDTVLDVDLAGGAELTKNGDGTLTLSGTNTYTGDTTINSGTLRVQGGAAILDTGTVNVTGDGRLELDDDETIGRLLGTGQVALGANTLTLGGDGLGNMNFGGVISGTGGVTKVGDNPQGLSGTNTFEGPLTVEAGVLGLSGGSAVANDTAVVVNGGTLRFNASETVGSLEGTGGRVVIGHSGTLTVGGNNADTIYEGFIEQSLPEQPGSLVKQGDGTLTLTGDNLYYGGTTINAGVIAIVTPGGVSEGPVTVNEHGTLRLIGGGDFDLGGLGISGTGAVEVAEGTLSVAEGQTLTLQGGLTNVSGGQVTVGVDGTLSAVTITNAEDGEITVLAGATLQGTGNTFNNAGLVTVGNGGTVNDVTAYNNLGTGEIVFDDESGGDVMTFAAPEISNLGVITLATGALNVNGAFTNEGGGSVTLDGNTAFDTDVTNQGEASFTIVSGTTTIDGGNGTFNNRGDATLTVQSGSTLDALLDNEGGEIVNQGVITGVVTNRGDGELQNLTDGNIGTLINEGTATNVNTIGTVTNTGTYTAASGNIIGDVTNSGTFINGSGNVGGDFLNTDGTVEFSSGSVIGTTEITGGVFTNIGGTLGVVEVGADGALVNNLITGAVTNSGTVISTGTINGYVINEGGELAYGVDGEVDFDASTGMFVSGIVQGDVFNNAGVFAAADDLIINGTVENRAGAFNPDGNPTEGFGVVPGGVTLTITGALENIEDAGDRGAVVVGAGSTISVALELANDGDVLITEGGTLIAGTVNNSADGVILVDEGATLRSTGATISNDGVIDVFTDGVVESVASNVHNFATGVINFNGPGGTATLSAAEQISNAGAINLFDGNLEVVADSFTNEGNGTVVLDGYDAVADFGGDVTFNSSVTNTDDASFTIADGTTVTIVGGVGTFLNEADAILDVQSGGALESNVTMTGGAVTIDGQVTGTIMQSGGDLGGNGSATNLGQTGGDGGVDALRRATAIGGTVTAVGPDGINAQNTGIGAVDIETVAGGNVSSVAANGITASTEQGDITIAAGANVSGGVGVVANSDGGEITVTVAETVTGVIGRGMAIGNNDGAVTVQGNSGTVVGATDGIAITSGGGNIVVDNLDSVTGDDGNGLDLTSGGGTITVASIGTITGNDGIGVRAFSSGGDVSIQGSGTVDGITGTGGAGISVSAGGGNIEIGTDVAVGAVSGSTAGIFVGTSGTGTIEIVTDGTITGGSGDGIDAEADGTISITTNGAVSGGSSGIFAAGNGVTVEANANVTGTDVHGINAEGGSQAAIVTLGDGVEVNGGRVGVRATSTGGEATVTLGNDASITSGSESGVLILTSGDTATVQGNSGTVVGATDGIEIASGGGNIVVDNLDSVTGNDGSGLNLESGGGMITVTGVDAITGTNGSGITANAGAGSISIQNSGTVDGITGTGGAGIDAFSTAGDINIGNTAVNGAISGSTFGIEAQTSGSGNVTIVTTSTVTGDAEDGILAVAETGTIDITTDDEVSGDIAGIAAGVTSGTISINANAAVTGSDSGIEAEALAMGTIDITTDGPVIGTAATGIRAASVGGNVTILANGTVNAGAVGIDAQTVDDGEITVTTGGVIGGTITPTDFGIRTAAGDEATAITVGEAVNSGGTGVFATSNLGAITMETTAAITGAADRGMRAASLGGDIVVNADGTGGGFAIDAGNVGIEATTVADGTVDVTVTENVVIGDDIVPSLGISAASVDGAINVTVDGDINDAAIEDAVNAIASGSGAVTVSGTGNLAGSRDTGTAILAFSNTGAVTVDFAGVATATGEDSSTIFAQSSVGAATVQVTGAVTVNNSGTGFSSGIRALSDEGAILVNNTGPISLNAASTGYGILTASNSGNITITPAGTIDGGARGISAETGGDGAIDIATTEVIGGTDAPTEFGIFAQTDDGNITVTADADVRSGGDGILARSVNEGDVTVDGDGNVFGASLGIGAFSEEGAVTVSGAGNAFTNGDNSSTISALSQTGISNVEVTRTGTVTNEGLGNTFGISARSDAGNILIDGIGAISMNADSDGVGILARSQSGDIEVTPAGSINGGLAGIGAETQGGGAITVVTSAEIGDTDAPSRFGITTRAVDGATDITVGANISAGLGGVFAGTVGLGAVTVTVEDGQRVEAGEISVSTEVGTGSGTISIGEGAEVVATGLDADGDPVAGTPTAIRAETGAGGTTTVTNRGTVQADATDDSLGLSAFGDGSFVFNNETGAVGLGMMASTGDGSVTVNNAAAAIWTLNADGTSVMAGANDTLNNSGTFNAAMNSSLTGWEAINNDGTINLMAGATFGGVGAVITNMDMGTINAEDGATLIGNLTNQAGSTISTTLTGSSDVTFTVDGDVSGSTRLQLNADLTDLDAGTSDLFRATGTMDGDLNVDFTTIGGLALQSNRIEFVRAESGFAGGFDLQNVTGLPTGGLLDVVISQDTNSIGMQVLPSTSLGGVAGTLGSVQAIIGSVVNRPSSPFVSRVLFEPEGGCTPGGWARGIIGGATSSTSTAFGDTGVSVPSTSQLRYRGLQGGFDVSCIDDGPGGLEYAFGVSFGQNTGSTRQDRFPFDPITGELDVSGGPIDQITGSFTQRYGAIYAVAERDNWAGDLQLRREHTSLTFNNAALGLDNSTIRTRGTTLSGSLTYFHSMDNGFTLAPTAGFAVTRTGAGALTFGDPDDPTATLFADAHTSKVGFVGMSLARSQVNEEAQSATTGFMTATLYNDFARTRTTRFGLGDGSGDNTTLTTNNLGAFGEFSVGMSYVKLFSGGAGAPRQFTATVRGDARFSNRLESYGLTAQMRLNF